MSKQKKQQAENSKESAKNESEVVENKWEKFSKEQDQISEVAENESVDASMASEESLVTPIGIDFPDHAELESQLTAAEKQAAEYKDQMLRVRAEMDNLRRRVDRDIANARKFGSEKLLADLLPVLDSLVRGLEAPESDDSQAKGMREGLSLTLDMLEKTLEKHGITPISPKKGEVFNPELHQAMSMLPGTDSPSNTVIDVVQKGYQLNGRVLRAAMVVVAQ